MEEAWESPVSYAPNAASGWNWEKPNFWYQKQSMSVDLLSVSKMRAGVYPGRTG